MFIIVSFVSAYAAEPGQARSGQAGRQAATYPGDYSEKRRRIRSHMARQRSSAAVEQSSGTAQQQRSKEAAQQSNSGETQQRSKATTQQSSSAATQQRSKAAVDAVSFAS